MRRIVRHIASVVLWLSVLCLLNSCIFERHDADCSQTGTDGLQTLFVLHISPMYTKAQASDRVVEKIKSIRVIAISRTDENGEGTIEINRYVKFDNVSASYFNNNAYSLTWTTSPGKKDFYIIANEESVGELAFTDDAPESIKDIKTLTGLLDYYKATPGEKFELDDEDAESTDNNTDTSDAFSAKDFKKAINSVYFKPQYRIENGEIFLPYSTCYENIEARSASKISKEMYLVPVATKFYFRFYNYHTTAVKIQKLTIGQTDSDNFLLGQVAEEEQTKNGDYWVDWLKKVADETHNNLTPDNGDINDQYGWISDYAIPGSSEQEVQTLIGTDGTGFVGGRERKAEETIPAGGPLEDMAGELYLGPYYFPESRHMITYDTKDDDNNDITVTKQRYTLGLYLHDTEVDSSTSNDFNEELVIENAQSLFRDTCVLIQISMRKGDVEVYAEMASWEHKEVAGWADGGSILN